MGKSKAAVVLLLCAMVITRAEGKAGRGGHDHKMEGCERDVVKLGACGSWLGLVREVIGTPPSEQCCSLVVGLADLEAALCFCSALGVTTPIALTLLLNSCHKNVPPGFVCS